MTTLEKGRKSPDDKEVISVTESDGIHAEAVVAALSESSKGKGEEDTHNIKEVDVPDLLGSLSQCEDSSSVQS